MAKISSATRTKSLKRKMDMAEEDPVEGAVAQLSPKKYMTESAALPLNPFAAAAPQKPTKSNKKPKKDKANISHSRTKQLSPMLMQPLPSKAEVKAKEKVAPVKKAKKSNAVVVEEVEDEKDEEEETHLHGFSTDEDSSDDDDMEVEPNAFHVGSLPTIAKDDATVKKKLEKAKRQPTGERGVLFLGRIPHGFYEDQMKAYFGQFGEVTRVRLSRNKKTGKSKHYGFIEFDSVSVANIVAETMDNYLLHGHIMQCKVIPKEKVHPELWVGANRKWRTVPPELLTRARHNKKRDEEEQYAASKRLIKRQSQRKRKLEGLGINYNFQTVAYKHIAKIV